MEDYFASFDGTRLFYRHVEINAKKPTLVFIHGLGANWTLWKDEILFFERLGYNTATYDLRGHGLSDIPHKEEAYSFTNFGKDCNALLTHLKLKKFILIGHSFGGCIALNYCALFKKKWPLSLIAVESAHRYPFSYHQEFNINPYVVSFLRFIGEHTGFRRKNFPHMKELDLTNIKNQNSLKIFLLAIQLTPLKSIIAAVDAIQEFSFNHTQDHEKFLASLKIPTLIIAGGSDKTIPVEYQEELNDLIKNSKLKIIMGAHHRIPLEYPEELCAKVLEFIEKDMK